MYQLSMMVSHPVELYYARASPELCLVGSHWSLRSVFSEAFKAHPVPTVWILPDRQEVSSAQRWIWGVPTFWICWSSRSVFCEGPCPSSVYDIIYLILAMDLMIAIMVWYQSIQIEESYPAVVILYFDPNWNWNSDVKIWLQSRISSCWSLSRPVFDRDD